MSLQDIFSSKSQGDIKREIVLELLDSEKNLDEKTELKAPLKWTCLKTIEDFTNKKELKWSESILKQFINQSHKYLISKDRKGRDEYIKSLQALSSMENSEQTTSNMLGEVK